MTAAAPAAPAGAGPTGAGAPGWPSAPSIAVAAGMAGAVLAATSTGSAVVAALLIGVATLDRRSAAAAVLAVLATALRFRTTGLDDLAGIQSVLGLAGEVGPATGAAASWLAAAAVLLAASPPPRARGVAVLLPALPCGLLAAALVAGPGPSELPLRLLTSVAGVLLTAGVVAAGRRAGVDRLRPWLAVAVGAAAVVLAGWPA